ncbi:methyltransferase domain-containing protein [Nitrosopumilus sp.]|uniref:methyltransferase domain-containing protein n=1 Tax=Nitrosopumilus sp. TaxID=2024843 RepID=UPI00247DA272|nr:methyltransferase domain-containing protein [Nitrosopumilus sp.]MCV0430387.1 class I SAM-dependent methyltransferase [Nitrosopumilus sp.]
MNQHDEDILKDFLNLHWLRPEVGPECYFRSKSLDGIDFESPSIDISCGDGQFAFVHMGGKFHEDFDNFGSTLAKEFKHSEFVDIHDSFDENYAVKILKNADKQIDYGTDWKQNLLSKAEKLGLYKNLVLHDNNKTPLPFKDDFFKTIYSNSVYWVDPPQPLLSDIHRMLHPEGRAVLHLFTPFHLETLDELECFLSKEAIDILDRKKRETMKGLRKYNEWKKLIEEAGFKIEEVKNVHPGKLIIDMWNIGLRPIAHLLIQMSESLSDEQRKNIKKEWVDIFFKLFKPLLNLPETYSLENSPYLCFILKK